MENEGLYIKVDDNGDVELLVQDCKLLVSSLKMSAISPVFKKLFMPPGVPLPKIVELPREDPVAFRIICQSAHDFFIPQNCVSRETLVTLADVVQRFEIPLTSKLLGTVEFCFLMQTIRPGTLSLDQIPVYLQVAKVLGNTRFRQLLEDVFHQHPLQPEIIPVPKNADSICMPFANIMLKAAACRAQIASTLLAATKNTSASTQQVRHSIATWMLSESPSLQEINLRLVANNMDERQERIVGPHEMVTQAQAHISLYLERIFEDAIHQGKHSDQEDVLDASHRLKELEIHLSNREVEERYPHSASRSSTEFEDIEEYEATAGEEYEAAADEEFFAIDDNSDSDSLDSMYCRSLSARTV